ncbi:MAG TPA: hypothetical protein VGH20_06700 [Myxococcales bacterium]
MKKTFVGAAFAAAFGLAACGGDMPASHVSTGVPGADSFTYTATGPGGTSSPGTVSATVNPDSAALSATLSASSWSAVAGGTSDPPIVVTAAGGTGSYTYSWTLVSGQANVAVSDASSASVTWSWNGFSRVGDKFATWRCQVFDSAGHSVIAGTVTVDIDFS